MTRGKDVKDIVKDTKGRKDTKDTINNAKDMIKDTICREDMKDTKENKDMKKGKDIYYRSPIMKSTYAQENMDTTKKIQ